MSMFKLAIYGHKKSGKTTLITNLIKHFRSKRLNVVSIKHIHHDIVYVDKEGKDTWKHREAGADIVVGISKKRMFIIDDTCDESSGFKRALKYLEENVKPDIILIEGSHYLTGQMNDIYKVILLKENEVPKGHWSNVKNIIGFYKLKIDENGEVDEKVLEQIIRDIESKMRLMH